VPALVEVAEHAVPGTRIVEGTKVQTPARFIRDQLDPGASSATGSS
jgi:hypothetical protein